MGKPSCNNCIKSKRICGGYTRKTAYVFSDNVVLGDNTAQDDGTLTYQGRWKGSRKPAKTAHYTGDRQTIAKRNPVRWADSDSEQTSDSCTSPESSALQVQRIPMMPTLWQQLHHVFLTTYMPLDGMGAADNPNYVTGNWLLQLRDRPSSLPALQNSIAAFASAQIGRQHNDMNVIAQSMQLYLRSLEHLRNAIANPKARMSDETLAACLALGVYELLENPAVKARLGSVDAEAQVQQRPASTSAYSKHMAGAMMLLKLRGPDGNNTPLAHSLFLGLRRQVIITTLIKHSDTFLSSPIWREKPWSVYPKNMLDKCLDCVLDLPALQRLADEMSREKDTAAISARCDTLIEQVNTLLANLDKWYADFEEWVSGPPYYSKFCALDSDQDDPVLGKPFPVSYYFPTFSTAYLLMTYWSGIMIGHWLLFSTCQALLSLAEHSTLDGSDKEAEDLRHRIQKHKDIWVAMTRNMCQMTEYLLSEGMGKVSVTVALAVLEGALAMFRDGTNDWARERAWIADMIALTAVKLNGATSTMIL